MSSPLSISHSAPHNSKHLFSSPAFHLKDLQNTGHDDRESVFFDFDGEEGASKGYRWQEIRNPKYEIGTLVTVTKNLDPQSQIFPELSVKGWRGRVEEAFTDGKRRLYMISLDSVTLKKLPPEFLREIVEEGERDNPFLFEVPETYLKKAVASDTEEEALQFQRLTYHTYFWGDIKKDAQAARMFKILTRDPLNDDIGNWLYYFENEVQYPIDAEVEGLLLEEIAPGTKVKVLGIEGLSNSLERGLIGSIQKGRAILSYPLMELLPLEEEDSAQQPLSDYRYWADFSLV